MRERRVRLQEMVYGTGPRLCVLCCRVHLQSSPCKHRGKQWELGAGRGNEGLELDVPCICTIECRRADVIVAKKRGLSAQCT